MSNVGMKRLWEGRGEKEGNRLEGEIGRTMGEAYGRESVTKEGGREGGVKREKCHLPGTREKTLG